MNKHTQKTQDKPLRPVSAIGSGASATGGGASGVAGAGMDRVIERRKPWGKWGVYAGVALIIGFAAYTFLSDAQGGRSFKVNRTSLVVSTVTSGVFEDFIPVRGRVTPLNTVFLDAIEGGRVERVLLEDGAIVEAGDLIVELSNTSLQLEVTRNEAAVTEQLNNMRTIELSLEQNRLGHRRNLVEINYQIKKLARQAERERELAANGNVSQAQLEDTEDDLEYYKNRLAVTLESQKTDQEMQDAQLIFLRSAAARLENNLEFARQNLDALNVRAPVAGKLSGFSAEVGQSIQRGGRLGQIDDPDNYKLRASIDEFYLGRVDLEQAATYERGSDRYDMRVAKIYPQVRNGQFEIDLTFVGEQPEDIRRGQTLQTKLTLGDANEASLIPYGAFYQDTGGNWVFVVTDDGSQAVRRNVRLGRRNTRFIEVVEGLEIGERVVTSPYTNFMDMDRLKLNEE